ncbi:hypothetical protein QFC24_005570 [Naganishia onofrii]|uniref:Uncharacterized protein n=1 Tax=Naganishia onofrii TaxID=1851511 RepID=A0ACC2X8A1_9TREE|nr:hypothetical protein QFC24_005570 [Naganishia onofrii]
MAYVAVAKALYDYQAQDPQDELSFKEDQVLYILEKEDEQWWKAKIKPGEDVEDADKVGLVPSNYVEESAPLGYTKAIYEYAAGAEDELSVAEDAALIVYDEADEWTLVAVQGNTPHEGGRLGFVPSNYIEPVTSDAAEVGGVQEEAAAGIVTEDEVTEVPQARAAVSSVGASVARKDSIETWSIHLMDKKKKKKGTLGVGNGAIFFASESDKVCLLASRALRFASQGVSKLTHYTSQTPVQQFPFSQLTRFSSPSSKTLLLAFTTTSEPLEFHTSSKDITEAILRKLESSKQLAGASAVSARGEREVGGLNRGVVVSPPNDDDDEEDETATSSSAAAAAAAKAVRWAEPSSTALPPPPMHHARGSSATSVPKAASATTAPVQLTATALYDFEAQGEDELSIIEGEILNVVDKSNEDWWTVKDPRGNQGVVPAQYVELNTLDAQQAAATGHQVVSDGEDGSDAEDERAAQDARHRDREEALEAEREEASRMAMYKEAEIRRQVQEEARQAEEDRIKREKKEKRRAEEERKRREEETARRRAAARSGDRPEPPKLRQRPSESDVAAARALPNPKGRSQPDRPKDTSRNRPNPARTRVWHDKTGQFRVEAEFLGLGNGKIRLHKLNGVIIEVPVEKMSPEDIAYIKKARRQQHGSSSAPASRSPAPMEDPEDDVPLGRMSKSSAGPSTETRARSSPAPNAVSSVVQQRPRKPQFDWFEFFLSAGCDMDDCTRYAANFERDRIDESILPDLEASTLRSLGLREGDVIRVKKAIGNKFRNLTPEQLAQIKEDEELARKLQEAENSGRGVPPNLFTQPDGKLANNTRRGRPEPRERKGTASSIDPSTISTAADKLKDQTESSSAPALLSPSPPPAPVTVAEPVKVAPLISGFDDDAWVPRPNSAKPATPTPVAPTPSISAPQPQHTGSTLTNQINNLHLNSGQTASSNNTDFLSQIPKDRMVQPQPTGMAAPAGFHSGLGMGSSNLPMGQLLTAQQTGAFAQQQSPVATGVHSPAPGAPLAPIPANQGLLNPLIPTQTGFSGFVPTRASPAMNNNQHQNQMMPQATGYNMNMGNNNSGMGMMPQQTGYNQYAQQQGGFQGMQPSKFCFPPPQTVFNMSDNAVYAVPDMTGYNGMQQQPNPMFNALASVPTQQSQPSSQSSDRFAPQSIFANMKRGEIGKSEHEAPQSAGESTSSMYTDGLRLMATMTDKYDALRPQPTGALMPLTTGYNGGMMPQQTGMMGQMGGYGNGMMGMNMTGMPQQQQQQTGYMNMQQTGFMNQNAQGGYRY